MNDLPLPPGSLLKAAVADAGTGGRLEAEYSLADDLLKGATAIATFTGLSRRQIYHAVDSDRLPVFRIGAIILARKSTLFAWVREQENGPGGK
jgi:hypothetical protein